MNTQTSSAAGHSQVVNDCRDHTLFSWTKQGGLNPIHAQRAEGVYIIDSEGKKYIDFSSQLMNVNIGHGHPKIKAAVMQQMDEVAYVYPGMATGCLLYTSPSPRDRTRSRMPSSA